MHTNAMPSEASGHAASNGRAEANGLANAKANGQGRVNGQPRTEGQAEVNGIPEATVARLPVYLRALYGLAERGISTVASEELAAAAGVNSAKLRKDLSHLGSYGGPPLTDLPLWPARACHSRRPVGEPTSPKAPMAVCTICCATSRIGIPARPTPPTPARLFASYYLGSMVSTYYDHQAVAIWKCCNGSVYNPPQRNYTFDHDFQTPAKLPPLTPMLRDINTIGYTQLMLPTQ